MKNTKIDKIIGIIFLVAFVLMIFASYAIGILHYLGVSVLSMPWGMMIYVITAFIFMGLSEAFFIKAGLIPQKLKIIIYIKWAFIAVVTVVSVISLFCVA